MKHLKRAKHEKKAKSWCMVFISILCGIGETHENNLNFSFLLLNFQI